MFKHKDIIDTMHRLDPVLIGCVFNSSVVFMYSLL